MQQCPHTHHATIRIPSSSILPSGSHCHHWSGLRAQSQSPPSRGRPRSAFLVQPVCIIYSSTILYLSLTKIFRCSVYDDRKKSKFLNYGKFDLFAALSVPDADCMHLETCIMFFFWAFSVCKLVTVCLALLAHILECRPTIFLMKVTCSQNLTQCKPGMTSLSVFIPTQMVPVHNIHMLQCSTSVYFRSAWVQNPWRNWCVLSSVLTRFRGTSTIGAYHRQVNNIWLENCISDVWPHSGSLGHLRHGVAPK